MTQIKSSQEHACIGVTMHVLPVSAQVKQSFQAHTARVYLRWHSRQAWSDSKDAAPTLAWTKLKESRLDQC